MRPVDLRPAAAMAAAAALLSCATLALWWRAVGAALGGVEVAVLALPALVTVALAFTSRRDRRQYVVRLLASSLMLPLLVGMWASDQAHGTLTIVLLVTWFAAHLAIFVGLIVWMASATTRIDAGLRAQPELALQAWGSAMSALGRHPPAFVVHAHADGQRWTVDCQASPDRCHRVELRVDRPTGAVRVRERIGASGAAPADAAEASMRTLGEPAIDAARPVAQQVWSRTWQTTVLEPGPLAAVSFEPGSAVPTAASVAAAADPEQVVHLLAAVALRCGLSWQPTLRQP